MYGAALPAYVDAAMTLATFVFGGAVLSHALSPASLPMGSASALVAASAGGSSTAMDPNLADLADEMRAADALAAEDAAPDEAVGGSGAAGGLTAQSAGSSPPATAARRSGSSANRAEAAATAPPTDVEAALPRSGTRVDALAAPVAGTSDPTVDAAAAADPTCTHCPTTGPRHSAAHHAAATSPLTRRASDATMLK